MARTIVKTKVAEAVIDGIDNAFQDYYNWSGGDFLHSAPEYMSTVYIAKSIAESASNEFVTLEHGTKDVLKEAGAITSGTIPRKIRPNGRVDMLLWHKNSTPLAIIEVKNRKQRFASIKSDVSRISKALTNNKNGSSLKYGLIAFHCSADNGTMKSASDKINDAVERMFDGAKHLVSELGCTIKKPFQSEIREMDDGAWSSCCFLIEPAK